MVGYSMSLLHYNAVVLSALLASVYLEPTQYVESGLMGHESWHNADQSCHSLIIMIDLIQSVIQ